MIKLQRTPKPSCLTPQLVKDLTDKFKADHSQRVWDIKDLKKALLAMSSGKCCYCECNITEESKYMEVEHFKYKDKYKDDVLEWLNLLPSCKRCNGIKSNHDVLLEPIINPSTVAPKDHLYYYHLTLYDKDDLGKNTIEVLNLNDSTRLVKPRFELWNELTNTLKNIEEIANSFVQNPITKRRNRVINSLKLLLEEAGPQSEYAAVYASILLNELAYKNIRTILQTQGYWDDTFQTLEQNANFCCLDLKIPS